jgi:polyisoprenoid-binding protein YceI
MPPRDCLLLLLAWLALPASAAAGQLELAPPASEVAIRAWGFGLLPFDGRFTSFRGSLRYDPAQHSCQVNLVVDVASLAMANETARDTIVGEDFMDAARFPTLSYAGACEAPDVAGTLGMHGLSRPLTLSLDWDAARIVATGELRRDDWGMTAMPILAGHTIRIRVSIALPQPLHASSN